MVDLGEHAFHADDGTRLVWQSTGRAEGRPLILIHGLFSDARTNWIKYGHAALLAAAGHRVIMPDLRGHGRSERPHDPARYPPDILASDGLALVAALDLEPGGYDLAGYSLGGRTALRMMALGARPRRAVLSGMGLQGVLDPGARAAHFRRVLKGLGTHPRGSPEFLAEAFLKSTGADSAALLPLLDSFVATRLSEVGSIPPPVLVLSGIDDHDNGSGEELADSLPNGRFQSVPGNHMSAVVQPQLGRTIAAFLA